MQAFQNFVNGEWAPAADGRTTEVVDPVTGKARLARAIREQINNLS